MAKRTLITRLQPRFTELVLKWIDENGSNQRALADRLKFPRPHLCSLLSGKRKLSTYYLQLFTDHGIIKMDQIYDGAPESEKEVEFWKLVKLKERTALLQLILEREEDGVDVEALLKSTRKVK